jgi:ankyrin repeat protein
MIALLIEKGLDVNARNDSGKTALMLAAFHGKLNAIKELRDNGASYAIRDNSGLSTLNYAVDGGKLGE